jgi:5-methylthioadenosine/S-adenosylhomocysteine deaminase
MTRILIEHVDAVTLDEQDRILHDAAIAIDGGRILSIGPGPAPAGFDPEERIDGTDHVAIPGLFNAHCHAAMALQRGWAEDLPFDRWLNERIWVAESALLEEDIYWGTALAVCEMLRAGVVAFADHYFWMDQVARLVEESGIKALLAWCFFGRGQEHEVGGITFETTVAFVERWRGAASGRIRTALGPHSPYMCPPEALEEVARAAARLGVPVHLHLAESEEQARVSLEEHGRRPVAHVARCGLLEQELIAAHCLAVDEEEIDMLCRDGVSVAHTPKTYMKLAMAQAPLGAMLDRGVAVALGTDGPASNSDLNMLEVLRIVGLQQKQRQQDPEVLPVTTLLRMACKDGARALGFARSGYLATGADADLVLLDRRKPHWYPTHDLAATVVYGSHPSDVSHVIVDGALLVRGGELTTLDEERICHEAERRGMRLVGSEMRQVRRYES